MDRTVRREIPRVPGHWFYGNLRQILESPHNFFAKAGPGDCGLFRYRVFNKEMVSIVDVDCAEYIFKTNSRNFVRGHQFKNLQAILGFGLITLEGDIWKRHRRLVAPAFKSDFLQYSFTRNVRLVNDILEDWERRAETGDAVDVVDQMRRFTLTVIVRALFSVDIDLDGNRQLYNAIVNANDLVFKRHLALVNFPSWVPTGLNRRIANTRSAIDRFTTQQLQLKRQRGNQAGNDIVDYLLEANKEDELSGSDLYDEIRTLFVAGFETTATSLAWALYLLARSPDIATHWQRELDTCLGARSPAWEDIGKLKYTENIVREALRLYPPAYGLSRVCLQDDVVEGYEIAAGTPVQLSIYGIQRSARYWQDPDVFRPERFAGDYPQRAFIPFGMGKHGCIGSRFSIIESILILASIGRRFNLSVLDDEEVVPDPRVTLMPGSAIRIKLESRH